MKKVAGIGSEAVKKRTGKGWDEWFRILDRAKAHAWPHKEIAKWLGAAQGVPGWWAQMVTVGYEQARGLRKVHQTAAGYQASASRTIAAPIGRLYRAWADARARGAWLGKRALTVRTARPNRSMRITWEDGTTNVEVMFYAKGAAKSQVTVQHGKLADAKAVASSKRLWGAALDALRGKLEA